MHKIFANSLFIGKKSEILPYCHSTNKVLADLIAQGKVLEGTLVLTSNQTAGRGQRGNHWESEPGKNLTFSFVLHPDFLRLKDQFYLNMIISLAVTRTVRSDFGDRAQVKWPNDVYVDQKKICGILIENTIRGHSIEHSIIGIGLNVNQKSFTVDKATSMSGLTLKDYNLEEVLQNLILQVEAYYLKLRNGALDQIKKEYLENLYWRGETHLFRTHETFSGEIIGVDDFGRLVVRSGQSCRAYDFKEISHIE